MSLYYTITATERGRTLTAIDTYGGETHTFTGSEADEAYAAIIKHEPDTLDELFDDMAAAMFDSPTFHTWSDRVAELEDGTFTYDGQPLPASVADVVDRWSREGRDIDPVIRFIERLHAAGDPAYQAGVVDRWLQATGMQVSEDGRIIGYKGLADDRRSISSGVETVWVNGTPHVGRIPQDVGDTVRIARADVDPDPERTCSNGLHVGSKDYAESFGSLTMVVAVDPADIVAIPTDYSGQKMRTTGYEILDVYDPDVDPEPPSRVAAFIKAVVPERLQRLFR